MSEIINNIPDLECEACLNPGKYKCGTCKTKICEKHSKPSRFSIISGEGKQESPIFYCFKCDFYQNPKPEDPLFPLGSLMMTPGATDLLEEDEALFYVVRHVYGDFGEDLDLFDWCRNIEAIQDGKRILSAYQVKGEKFWIITEADRSVTTVLRPSEY